jgi:histone H3/H4
MNQQEKDANTNLIEQIQESAINIIQPVFEKSMILAAEYAKACGRDIVLAEDMEYAMKYCAMYEVGKKLGTHFPDIDEEEYSDEEIEEYEDVPFTRYSGREYKFVKMNMAYDNWNTWEPKNPSERMLKNAIDSNEHIRSRGMVDDF